MSPCTARFKVERDLFRPSERCSPPLVPETSVQCPLGEKCGLALGVIRGDHESQLHRRYLDAFFEEEFDADTAIESTQKRDMIPRKKIQAYLSDTGLYGTDRSSLTGLFRTMHKAYSGYVHAASPQIMDMYGGAPARFHMRGMSGSIVHVGHKEDLRNLFYRGTIVCGVSPSLTFGVKRRTESTWNISSGTTSGVLRMTNRAVVWMGGGVRPRSCGRCAAVP